MGSFGWRPVYAGVFPRAVLVTPDWLQKAFASFCRSGVGVLFMCAGLLFIIEALAGRAAQGVPAFVLVAAGLTFCLGGALASPFARSGDTVLRRTLTALLITTLATTAIVFPPSLLFMAPITVLSWIAVVRLVVQKRIGRDPLGGWSDERQLGLGCGVTIILALLLIGLWQLHSCGRKPPTRPATKPSAQHTAASSSIVVDR